MSRVGRGLLLTAPVLALFGAALAVRANAGPLLLQNVTPSLPLGLYLRTPDAPKTGIIIAVRQPEPARGYLRDLGYPPDALLLKRVAAGPGDRACRLGDRVVVARRFVGAFDHDSKGQRLPVWRECRALRQDELFLLGDTAGSFDSRYFGPVKRSEVVGVYRKVGG